MKKLTILLVDDSPEDLELATRALRRINYIGNILNFKDGGAALDFLSQNSSNGTTQKLILLDMNMPGMGGLEFIRKIKASELTRNIPIAVLTATTELPDIKESMRLGVEFYIPKPLETEDIDKIAMQLGISPDKD